MFHSFAIALSACTLLAQVIEPAAPTISVRRTSSQEVEITWSRGDFDWILEETSALSAGGPALWSPAQGIPIVWNSELVASIRAESSAKFYRLRSPDLLGISESSPAHGETGVAVTRETVLQLTEPLAATNLISNAQLYAEAAGRRILSRIELSSNRKTVTLFYLEDLPGSARVRVTFRGEGLADTAGRPADLDQNGQPGGSAIIEFDTLTLTPVAGTAVIGKVFASELVPSPDNTTQSVNQPLAGVTITVDGMEETLRTTSDAQGNFRLEPVPAGRFFVHVDGRTAVGSQWPDGAYYPYVGKAWEAVAGVTTNLASGTGEIFLPKIVPGTLKPVSATEATSVTFPAEVLQKNPELAGVSLQLPANNLVSKSGARGGKIGIAPVPPDRLPEPLPPGLEFPIVITVQTDGAENFDQPVPACFPNLPDPGTGQPLPPGTRNWLYSFDHDIGQFVPVGPMTVSADGKLICTDSGVGIREPGWHGSGPPPVEPPPPEECEIPEESGFAAQDAGRLSARNEKPSVQQCLDACLAARVKCLADLELWLLARERSCKETEQITSITWEYCLTQAYQEMESKKFRCVENEKACQDACVDCSAGGVPPMDPPMEDPPMEPASASNGGTEEFSAAAAQNLSEEIHARFHEISNLLWPYISARQSVPQSVWDLHEAQWAEITALAGGDLRGFLQREILQAEGNLARVSGGEYWTIGNAPPYPILYVATVARTNGLFYLRGETGPHGQYTLFVPRDGELLDVSFYDPRANQYGTVFPIQSPQSRYRVPRLLLAPLPEGSPDLDGDNLADAIELVFGTDWSKVDSDNDGINDGAEVAQGTNPLDGLGVRIGVIAAADTAGTAVDIAIQNDLAVVAGSDRGVAIFDLSRGLTPILAAVVDTPGIARAVASSGSWVAVADGNSGLAIIDLANPTAARLSRQVNVGGSVQAVAAAGGIAYAGVSTGLVVAVDLVSGTVMKTVQAGARVHDLQIEGDILFVLLGEEIASYRIIPSTLEFLGRVATFDLGAESLSGRKRLFVGGSIAYASTLAGFETFDVRNPAAMRRLGPLSQTGPRSFKQLVADGFGYGVGAVGINTGNDGNHDAWLYDLSNPALTDRFLTVVATPGVTYAVSVNNGLVYSADGAAGLQVINYREADRSTNAPTISLTSNFSAGKAEEGRMMRLTADARDDVQVRNVEFYLDDMLIETDGNFPFQHYFETPRATAQKTSFRLKARATDTAGNSTWSSDLVINLVPDATPPRVLSASPTPGLFLAPGAEIIAYWSEALNSATVDNATFQIISAGPDGLNETSDDLLISGGTVSYRPETNATVLTFATDLPPGSYRGKLSTGIADLAGNSLATEFTWRFVSAGRIGFGQTVAASLGKIGEKDFYAFNASAGDQIHIRLAESGPITPYLELLAAGGTKLGDNYTFSSEAVVNEILQTDGTFFVSVSDREGGAIADYGVFLQRLNAPAGAKALTFGQVANGAVASRAEVHSYSFTAAAGDRIRVRMTEPGALSPKLQLFDAQGVEVAEESSFGSEAVIDYGVQTGGSYLVLLSDYAGTATGSYGIFLQRLNSLTGADTLTFGQTTTNSIQNLAEADSFTFQAAAGDRIRVRMSEPGPLSPKLELFNAQGERISEESSFSSEAVIDYRVPTAGGYLVLASDYSGAAQGSYGLSLQRLSNPAGANTLEVGRIATGSISHLAESDAYIFQAIAGDRIRVRMSEPGTLSPKIELFDSTGEKVAENSSFGSDAIIDYSVPATGGFVLLVSDYSGASTGDYAVFLQRLNGISSAATVAFGQIATNSISTLAESDAYTFQAAAGDRIRIRMSEPGPLSPKVELFDSTGAKLAQQDSFSSEALLDFRVSMTGAYLFLASDYSGVATGAYSVFVQRLNLPAGATTLQLGEARSASIDNLAEADAYIIQATAGVLLRVLMTEPGPLSPRLELFDSLGERVAEASSFGSEVVLEYLPTSSGQLFLLAGDSDGADTGQYNLILEP